MAATASSLIEGIGNALREFGCQQNALTEPFVNPLFNLYRTAAYGGGPVSAAKAELVIAGITAARNYYDQFFCDGDPAALSPLDFSPGFSGGQCPFLYFVRVTWDDIATNGAVTPRDVEFGSQLGPIGGVRITSQVENASQTRWRVIIDNAAGEFVAANVLKATVGQGRLANAQIVSVRPSSAGNTDNCGDPPPLIPEGSDSEGGELDIDAVDENGDPVSFPNEPFVIFNPTINQDGDLVVEVNLPDLGVCGDFVFGEGGGFSPKSCGPTNQPERPIAQDPEGDGTTTPDEDFDEDESLEEEVGPGETILGVIIKSQAVQPRISQTQAPNGEGPVILVPRIAAVSFRVEAETKGPTLTGWTDPQDLRSVDAYYPAPQGVRVTNSSVTWQPNWQGTKQNVVGPWPPEPPPPPTVTLA